MHIHSLRAGTAYIYVHVTVHVLCAQASEPALSLYNNDTIIMVNTEFSEERGVGGIIACGSIPKLQP